MKRLLLITGIAVISFAQCYAASTTNSNTQAPVTQTNDDEDDDALQLLVANDATMSSEQSKQSSQSMSTEPTQTPKMLLAGTTPSADQAQQQKGAPAQKNGQKNDPQTQQQPQLLA